MELKVNPHELLMIGENSFLRLSEDEGRSVSTRCSHWRVLWSPAGAGHALFVESELVGGVRIYADDEGVSRFLQKEIEYLLHAPFADVSIPVIAASFLRVGSPPGECHELVTADQEKDELRLSWSDFLKPFNFEAPVGFSGRPIGCQTTFFPAKVGTFSLNSRRAVGKPWALDRGGRQSTTASLAWCETWFRPLAPV